MVRQTSAAAYAEVLSSGCVGRVQKQVYAALFEVGPCTGGELFYHMQKTRNPTHSNICTRLGELRDKGLVRELGRKVCEVSGMSVILWDVTTELPKKPTKPTRLKCTSCNGKGYHEQGRLF